MNAEPDIIVQVGPYKTDVMLYNDGFEIKGVRTVFKANSSEDDKIGSLLEAVHRIGYDNGHEAYLIKTQLEASGVNTTNKVDRRK